MHQGSTQNMFIMIKVHHKVINLVSNVDSGQFNSEKTESER